jgi:acyl-CoA thioesterase-1
MCIKDNSIVLFQGDSVTDCGRNRETDDLGNGYASKIAQYFKTFKQEKNVKFINKGISGHRTCDLVSRWTEDCIALKPDYVSILIGINDVWRRYDSNMPMSAEEFEANYRIMLTRIKNETNAEIVLMEPFLAPVREEMNGWYEDLAQKILIVRKLAREFNAILIPLDGIFAIESAKTSMADVAADGVHPTDKGHAIIAKQWIKATKSR